MSSVTGRVTALRDRAIRSALLEGLGVLLILALAFLFTVAVGRSMTRPLARLRSGALEVAGVRLPETVRRMSESGDADAPPDIEPIDVDSTDEIGQVARAFDQVHREAVRLAANEAALRGNVNAMFVNLSRRSQSLVERQIKLIDDLEQGEQDSDRLANLFQLDHLATRMRRNSENLLVLAGHELSRRWTEPVALVDVLRAAVSEIEHYERVIPNIQPGISVRGQAVSDVVHLLSELAENATAFSAEETPVKVSGYVLSSGGALVDITDQGVGMPADEMAHANWRLDNPPLVDVAVSRRMGLFVVARLAARHGIRVRLRPGSAAGLTALVWLPDEVISREGAGSALGAHPFQPPAAGTFQPPAAGPAGVADAAARWLENGLAVGDPGVRAPATSGLPPMQPLRFEPSPEGGDGAAAPTVPGAAPHAKAVLSAPAADTGTASPQANALGTASPQAKGLGTANPETDGLGTASPETDGLGTGTPIAAGEAGSPGATSPAPTVIVPAAPDGGPEHRLPIYESVESDWFRRGLPGTDRPATSPAVGGQPGAGGPGAGGPGAGGPGAGGPGAGGPRRGRPRRGRPRRGRPRRGRPRLAPVRSGSVRSGCPGRPARSPGQLARSPGRPAGQPGRPGRLTRSRSAGHRPRTQAGWPLRWLTRR